MNLCIDQGNSRTKVALMTDEGKMINHFIYKTFSSADVERLFDLYPITDSIISSVINIEPAIVNTLNRHSQHFVLFDHMTPVPIRNGYDTPETLGQDRLAAAVGAKSLCPDENLLIIDAGSAITYDFVSAEGEYIGGNIAPGLKMRFTMLQRMTNTLSEKVTHFQTYLTGGNAPYIINNVRNSRTEKRELRYEKHLVLIGLNHILIYNKKS